MKIEIKFLYIFLIIILSTAFSLLLGEGDRNLLLIGFMYIVPVLTIIQFPFLRKSEWLIYLLMIAILAGGLRHMLTFRISTILYSFLFIVTFIYGQRLLSTNKVQIELYIKVIKFLIIAYFIVLVIQQISILLNIDFVFNLIHSGSGENKFKLNSLAPEPSHTARILFLLMYSFIIVREINLGRKYSLINDWGNDFFIWTIFLYSMLTMGSAFAFLLLMLFALKFIRIKDFMFIIPMALVVALILLNLNISALDRVIHFGQAVFTFDTSEMLSTDHSASFRIVPSLLYLDLIDFRNPDFWLGYGIDYDKILFPSIIPGLPEGTGTGGIFPTFLLNYGVISGVILFAILTKFCFRKILSFDTLVWIIVVSTVAFNTQIVWLGFILFATNKYYYQRQLQVH